MSLLPHITPTVLDLLFIVVCIGLLATELWVIPYKRADMLLACSEKSEAALLFTLHASLWRLLALALAGLTLMSVIGLLLRTAEMSGLPWREAFSAIPLVLFGTHYGMTWFVRVTAVGVLWFAWWGVKTVIKKVPNKGETVVNYPLFTPFLYVMFLAMAGVVWSVSASSHAADWGDFTLPEWMGWLHIMAGSMWLGGILAFALVIRRGLHGQSQRERVLFAACAGGLSRLAGIALVLVLATGIYNVWRQLDCFSDLWFSDYGRIILFKLVLVGFMVAMGALSRYFNLPFLCREAGVALPGRRTAGLQFRVLRRLRPSWIPRKGDALPRQFGQRVTAEAWLALGVLICAALLGHAMPPKKHADIVRHVMLQNAEAHVMFRYFI